MSNQSLQEVLAQRGNSHGHITIQAALSQEFKAAAMASPNWDKLEPYQKECIEMILHKVSRALTGDYKEPDHYKDIAGYSTLVERELTK
jgi:hypothetical protein